MLTDQRIEEIVARHRPRGVELRWKERLHFNRKRELPFRPAHACDTRNEIYCCDPHEFADDEDRRRALAIFLHECGHFRAGKGHFKVKLPRHVEEYEAERWGHAMMRLEGVPIPRKELQAAKKYVASELRADESRGIKIEPRVRRWVRT